MYLCPDDDLVNKLKIWLFKAFCVIFGWSFWILKYIKKHIFELFFIFLKTVCWKRILRFIVGKYAIRLECISKKIEKCKLNIHFLLQCCDTNIIPNFTSLNKLKQINKRSYFKLFWKLLYDETSNKHRNLKELHKQQQ